MGPAPSHQPQNRPAVNLNKIRQNSVQKVQKGLYHLAVLITKLKISEASWSN